MSKAKSIMIQGTMSSAGKSLIVAGLCRVFAQDGYRVAPFKSQNMALNSFITKEGLEMGRAQVMQAEAAMVEPSVLMNPILLKPTNDIGSQVIVNGEVRGNMSAKDYYAKKKELVPDIMNAYRKLEEEYDIIVIEGAGSPAEINLKDNDIVNMGMAKMANAPVLLVGDIDRGGVFAQLLGTVEWLDEDDKKYLKGMIINKFRGDKSILMPGIDMLEDRVHYKVLGVVPYVYADIDDEDSVSERFERKEAGGNVDIAVIRLPRISNFTDFNMLESMPDVNVRYVKNVNELKEPDVVILPGTKNTMDDLKWLRSSGLEARIKSLHAKGKIIFGICGGYQMLGKKISDPESVEAGGDIDGIGLLDIVTIFDKEKKRTRVIGEAGKINGVLQGISMARVEGYEIHMGNTTVNEEKLLTLTSTLDGSIYDDGAQHGNVYGTYVHGIFDSQDFLEGIVNAVLDSKGINRLSDEHIDIREYKEKQYDILADAIRNNIDMDIIYNILERGTGLE